MFRNGDSGVYVNLRGLNLCYPHAVETLSPRIDTYTSNGLFSFYSTRPHPLDIVEVFPFDQDKADEWELTLTIERIWK